MTPSFIRRVVFALLATLALCGVAVWINVPHPVTAARTVCEQMQRDRMRVEEAQQIAIHPESTPAQKLGALRYIRDRNIVVGEEPRNPEVVAAMVELFAETTHPDGRADILRQLSGVTTPVLLPTLLEALKSDPSHSVREEAAETLAGYISSEGVRKALTHSRDTDTDPRVVGRAHWVLHSNPEN